MLQAQETGAPEMQAMMDAWMKNATPNEKHEALKFMLGKWTVNGKMRMSKETPFMDTKGKAEATTSLGGRFVEMSYHGEASAMMPAFQGHLTIGYDNMAKAYNSLWRDSMSTQIVSTLGKASDDHKVFTFTGSYMDPMTRTEKPSKWIISVKSDDEYTMEMQEKGADGEMFSAGSMTYTRVK